MKTQIIVGLGYGDEGKGLATDYLVANSISSNPIVVRFSGGHQAGHTVRIDDYKHTFSNFGSGTLRNVPTFWSKYCTLYPTALVNEYKSLVNDGYNPKLFVDPLSMITTPYDVAWNRVVESKNKHGSVGVGFGTTIERNENNYRLYAQDLLYPTVFREKLANIARYYNQRASGSGCFAEFISFIPNAGYFDKCVEESLKIFQIKDEFVLQNYDSVIFEGAQGTLLDQKFGFFPHVTRSNATIENAIEIIKNSEGIMDWPSVWYVTRCYQTRHGNGFMSDEMRHDIKNEGETNIPDEWQGFFRKGYLDIDLLRYAIECNRVFYESKGSEKLLVTCLDHMKMLKVIKNNEIVVIDDIHDLGLHVSFSGDMYISKSPFSDKITRI